MTLFCIWNISAVRYEHTNRPAIVWGIACDPTEYQTFGGRSSRASRVKKNKSFLFDKLDGVGEYGFDISLLE